MAGYACAKIALAAAGGVYLFLLFWIVVPPLVLLVPVYIELVELPLLHRHARLEVGIVLVYTAVNLPFNVYLMTAYFRSLPDELLEAARIDGAGIHRTFLLILLPAGAAGAGDARDLQLPVGVERVHVRAVHAARPTSTKPLTVAVQQLQGRFDQDSAGADGRPADRDAAGDRRLPDLPAPPRPRHRRRGRQVKGAS